MGSLCGKLTPSRAPPGRFLGSVPDAALQTTSSVPRKVGGPPRTLGHHDPGQAIPPSADDARIRAGEAAEARAQAALKGGKGGKLQGQIAAQKKLSRADT